MSRTLEQNNFDDSVVMDGNVKNAIMVYSSDFDIVAFYWVWETSVS